MLEIRTIDDAEIPAFREAALGTFGTDSEEDPTGTARQRALISPARSWVACDGGQIVGTAASYALQIAMPGGGAIAAAGLTMVAVRPTHRRRGLLRALIAAHLADQHARGEVASALWASEGTIYGRFGYGVAAEGLELELDTRGLELGADDGAHAHRLVDEAEARARLPAIYARALAERPGVLRRDEVWWRERRFLEVGFMRAGASRRRHVIASRGAEAVGYVAYRQRESGDAGRVEVLELVACDAAAETSLWRFLAGVDLFPRVAWPNAPVDLALPWQLPDRRRAVRRFIDTLWLRIDDVAGTLAARRYAHDGVLRFALDGEGWELRVERGAARCTRTDDAPELVLDRAALGSLVLGAVRASTLARAGRVHGTTATADALFVWPIAPWCPEQF
jgi:predicted acetyltransferase